MKKRFYVLVTVVLGIFFLAGVTGVPAQQDGPAGLGQIVQNVGGAGNINWTTGTIEATGIGVPPEKAYGKPQARPMALRAAQLDAYRKLLEVTNGVRISSATLVRDYVVKSDVIRSQVQGMVRGARIIKRDYLSDGTCEVTLSMPLNGASSGLAQAIYPSIMEPEPVGLTPIAPLEEPATPAVPSPQKVQPSAPDSGVVYTGLVVDARGIKARPAMSPKIIDENGNEVYGSMYVDREYAVQQGMSGYARDLTAAQSNSRVTNNPFTVKGLKSDGPGKSNIVISMADAEELKAASGNLAFMKKCRVMIVLD